MWTLAVDATTRSVVEALQGAGVPCLLFKGPSVSGWLYDDASQRTYVDSDILVNPARTADAAEVLTRLGFRRDFGPLPHPGMEAPPSHPWRRGRLTVDLHETVPGATAARPTVFAELNTGAEVLEVAGGRVPVPGEHARLVLVALHAAHHGPRVPGPLNDLRAALERGSEDDWSSAARCAAAIGAEGAFAEGLSLAPAGAALLARLGIESRTSVAWLLARDGPPVAAGIERLASAAGVSARVAVLRDELLPTAEFMRWSSPLARRSSRGLAAAYVQRWFYLLSRGPRAFAAWRQARKRLAQ